MHSQSKTAYGSFPGLEIKISQSWVGYERSEASHCKIFWRYSSLQSTAVIVYMDIGDLWVVLVR